MNGGDLDRADPLLPAATPDEHDRMWTRLRAATPARIGLGRVGAAPPLAAVLDFQLAHGQARDAVHAALDVARLEQDLAPLPVLHVESDAADRATYLRRPDLGRRLSERSVSRLPPDGPPCDVVFVIGDGLSAAAVQSHAAALVKTCSAELVPLTIGPVVIARQARVALGDPIGERLNARVCAIIVGERPGLTVATSLGIYLTFAPRTGRRDSERNCISNIHAHGGLSLAAAARAFGWLVREALRRQLSGVDLKDDRAPDIAGPAVATATPLPGL